MQHEITKDGCVFRSTVDAPSTALGLAPDIVAYEISRGEAMMILDRAREVTLCEAMENAPAYSTVDAISEPLWFDVAPSKSGEDTDIPTTFDRAMAAPYFHVTSRDVSLVVQTPEGRVESEIARVTDLADVFGLEGPSTGTPVTHSHPRRRRPSMR